jgi:uncharacterized protein (TIGR02001 family)
MTMRFILSVASLAVLATPAIAQEFRFTTNGQIVSDYRNRGISRSDEGGALQGRAEVEHVSGAYAGLGASSIDMESDKDANVEGIVYGGYKGNYDGIEYDAKLGYTAYPGGDNDDMDYLELEVTGGYNFDVFYGSMTWAFSPDYINGSGASFYYGGDVSVPINESISAKAHLGYDYIANEGSYVTDWSLGGWYNYAPYDLDFGLEYVDTDLDKGECVDKCGARGVLTVSKSLSW